jgi:hypothetical protein
MRSNMISSDAVSWTKPKPTFRAATTCPSTSRPAGNTGAPSQSGDWIRTARISVPGLELYDATGSSKRTQKDFPGGIFSQFARTGCAEVNAIKEKQKKAAVDRKRQPAELADRQKFSNTLFKKILIPKTPEPKNQLLYV